MLVSVKISLLKKSRERSERKKNRVKPSCKRGKCAAKKKCKSERIYEMEIQSGRERILSLAIQEIYCVVLIVWNKERNDISKGNP